MVMKKPPVTIPPPAGCRNKAPEALDWTFEVTASLIYFVENFSVPMFLG